MIDTGPIRRALEQAARDLTVLEHSLRNLALAQDASPGATVGAQERDVTVAGTGMPPHAVVARPGAPEQRHGSSTKRCKLTTCGKSFTPKPRGAKALYCSPRCRTRAAVARQRERAAAERRRFERESAAREKAERASGNGESRDPMQSIRGWKPWPDPAVT